MSVTTKQMPKIKKDNDSKHYTNTGIFHYLWDLHKGEYLIFFTLPILNL